MKKILLVEDDFTMIALLRTLLNMEGFEVETLLDKNGDLIENIRQEKPDFLLMDVFLGDRNGMNLVRNIRATPDLKELKIIMVSGLDKAEECAQAGANAFLLKPYSVDQLLPLLRSAEMKSL